jgi:hypothetical protein
MLGWSPIIKPLPPPVLFVSLAIVTMDNWGMVTLSFCNLVLQGQAVHLSFFIVVVLSLLGMLGFAPMAFPVLMP